MSVNRLLRLFAAMMVDHQLSKIPNQSTCFPKDYRRYRARNPPPTSSDSLKLKRVEKGCSCLSKMMHGKRRSLSR